MDIEAALRDGGMTPPDVAGLADGRRPAALLRMLVDLRRCVLLEGQLAGQRIVFHRDAVQWAHQRLGAAYPAPAQFTVSDARHAWDTSRKFAVPLLAHFDKLGYTRREGDLRTMALVAQPTESCSAQKVLREKFT